MGRIGGIYGPYTVPFRDRVAERSWSFPSPYPKIFFFLKGQMKYDKKEAKRIAIE